MSFVLLIVGFALLIKGADIFVDSASAIAKRLRIPSMVIGLTVVSMGTSLPEASVSIAGSMAGANEIAISNVIGSNMFNVLIVAGLAAVLRPIAIEKATLKIDYPVCIAASILMLAMCFDFGNPGMLSRIDGIILLALMVAYICFLIKTTKDYQANLQEEEYIGQSLWKSIVFGILGVAAIIWGGDLTVDAAVEIAAFFGMSETLIGLTVIAVGTSLPELVTSVMAIRKGENDIAIGNVIGSNIFNIFFVLGMSAAISPIPVASVALIDGAVMLGVMFISYALCATAKTLAKREGALMVMLYLAYMVYAIIRN
ncbi:MAG: calcium/sodium antiporter [Firmicutes bacterium]|nr:calcium/sodium antiporter [Bacillota bacterium]